MKVILQRCTDASVKVDNRCVGCIDRGLMLLVGFTEGDSNKEIDYMVDKIINLRIFDDENGVMNKSLIDVEGDILSISQFTLYADTKKGRRPSYIKALRGEESSKLYELFNNTLRKELNKVNNNLKVEKKKKKNDMKVNFTNDGPVTIILEKGGDNNGE